VIISLISGVSAAVNNATVTAGSESSYSPSTPAGNTSAQAGGTIEVNLSVDMSTQKWAGFYGQITGTIKLADASSNTFKDWTVSNVAGAKVYSSNTTTIDWANLAAATNADMPAWLTSGSDSWANTFNNNETQTFNGQNINANYTLTYNSTGTGVFKTYSLKDSSSNLIWAALAVDNGNGYNNQQVDYQLLVPVNGASATTYYFYLELP